MNLPKHFRAADHSQECHYPEHDRAGPALKFESKRLNFNAAISKSEKEEHLKHILSGWATVVRYACLFFKTTLDTKEINIGSLKLRLSLPEDVPTKVIRAIFLSIPTVVSHWLRGDLGTQKLEAQLKNDDIPVSLTAAFLQKGLYADLKLREYIAEISKLHKSAEDSEFLLEALLVKLRDIYIRYGLAKEEEAPFLSLVAEIGADAQGLTGDARKKRIAELKQDLKDRRTLAKIGQALT